MLMKMNRDEKGQFCIREGNCNNQEWLHQKYVTERLSWDNFYKLYQISPTLLQNRLKEFGIKRKRNSWNKGLTSEMDKRLDYERPTCFKKGHIVTEEIRQKISKAISGENHVNWKGGITPDYITERRSKKMKLFRIRIMERDNHTCQDCGVVGGKLCVHHIKSFAFFPKRRYDEDNCITLCKDCHKLTDNYLSKAKNARTNYFGQAGIGFA